jgi:nifR3 family TIM-barrel protein
MLAPMANVTDTAFRQIVATHGRPDLMVTEFTSCEGLCSAGRERLLRELEFSTHEQPLLAQLFGPRPETFYECGKLVRELGFAGVDINTGCPDRAVVRQGAGCALIGDATRIGEIIAATKEGAGDLPVSVKTRLGVDRDILDQWLPALLAAAPAAIAIHARTMREQSAVPAHWDAIERAVQIAAGSGVAIVGNGDVADLLQAERLAASTGADGVMLGRAIFGNPWLFNRSVSKDRLGLAAVLQVMLEHARLFESLLGDVKNFVEMRRHFKAYVGGFPQAKQLRVALMGTSCLEDAEEVVAAYLAEQRVASAVT